MTRKSLEAPLVLRQQAAVGLGLSTLLWLGCAPTLSIGAELASTMPKAAAAKAPLDEARARLDEVLTLGPGPEVRAVLDELRRLGASDEELLLAEARILAGDGDQRALLGLIGDLGQQPISIRANLALLAAQAHALTDAHEEVRAALAAGLAVAPDDVGLLLALSRLERTEEHWQPAYKALRRAMLAADHLGQQAAAPWQELGELELARGRADAALAAFDAALARDPNAVAARLRRALILLDRGDFTAADGELRRTLSVAGARVPIVALQALSATLQDQPDEARALAEQVLATEPDNAVARYVGAYLDLTAGAVESARRKLDGLRQTHPEFALIDRLYGLVLLQAGDLDAGKELLEDYLAARPDDLALLGMLEHAMRAQGRGSEARAFQNRRQRANDMAQALVEARKLLTSGDEASAAALARALTADTPVDAVAHQLPGLAMAADDPDGARAAFDKAWTLAPGDPTLAAQLGGLAFARGDLPGARAVYSQVLEMYPGHRASLSGFASLAGSAGDDAARLAYLNEALRFHPDDGEVRVALARDLLERGERAPALLLAKQTPTDAGPDGWLVRYRIEAAAGDWEAAAVSARALRDLDPDSATAWLRLGEAEGRAGRIDALRGALVAALQRTTNAPADGDILLRLSLLSGGPGEITATLKRLAERQPENPAVLDAVGLALLADNQLAEAVAHYGAAHRLLPGNPLWTLRQAGALGRLGRPGKQLAVLEYGAMQFAGDKRIRVALGDAYAANGRMSAAELAYLGAGDDADALERLARLTAASDAAAAADYARRAITIDPSPSRLYAFGVLSLQSGAPAEAIAVLRRLLRRQPGHADARYHLALALHKLGEDAAARQLLTALLRSPRNFPMRDAASILYGQLTP